MLVVLLSTTMLLMFLAFGSVVLPIKAAVMSALTLGSTLGILTWIFVDGHFSKLLNFTPTPLMVVLIALVIAVGFGLATDYEVFLVSRMVEARARGMSTAEAIRIGTATTGRLITAAALVLAVVAGSFVFSDLVMMKYLAFGLMAALLLDATVVRMFLVPVGDEAARRRLLVGPDVDEAPAEPVGTRRDSPARRAQAAVAAGTVCSAGDHHPPAGHVDTPSTARPHASQRRWCAAAEPTGCASAPGRTSGRRLRTHHRPPAPRECRLRGGPSRKRHRRLASRLSRTRRPDVRLLRRRGLHRPLAEKTARSSPGSATCGAGRPATRVAPAPRRRSRPRTRPGRCRFRANNRRPSRPPNPQTPPPRSRHRRGTRRTPTRPPRNSTLAATTHRVAAAAGSALPICYAAKGACSGQFGSG